ncbi:hypothetical protein NXS08_00375 [Gleimia sp. 6138-11-ORH1]|uniref:hypothetical protein n=1 Tax=Gleimia sp. 6138-11-ORH1 TaxID=2973937 RepID=UPI002169B427|nr:hypothetical protein [Gleimia sp. 6138-11-ORH1]MCS4483948.1 hypothetical protein [Gleimia sp. 6138-11-ORH1]
MRLNKVSFLATAVAIPTLFLSACGGLIVPTDNKPPVSLSEQRSQSGSQNNNSGNPGTQTNPNNPPATPPTQTPDGSSSVTGFYEYFQRTPHDEFTDYREMMLERDLLIGLYARNNQIDPTLKSVVDAELAEVDLPWPTGHPNLPAEYVMPILVGATVKAIDADQYLVTSGIQNPWVREFLEDTPQITETSITYKKGDARVAKIYLWQCAWVEDYANALHTRSADVESIRQVLSTPQVQTILDESNRGAADAWRRDLPVLLNPPRLDTVDDWLDLYCDEF